MKFETPAVCEPNDVNSTLSNQENHDHLHEDL
jgi:hypothetical protein